uniref:Uncharacterized protein n=1 Tax=Anguilla anguilla TaxID=7936 RepID=A0A0E9T2Y7_ANGAN
MTNDCVVKPGKCKLNNGFR